MRGYQKLSNLLYLPLVMKAIGMPTVSAPTIRMYGGVHDDPGSRQRFLEELAKRETVPHFVAVEWEQSVFTQLSAWRSRIKEGLSTVRKNYAASFAGCGVPNLAISFVFVYVH